jgi:hypothetical protein
VSGKRGDALWLLVLVGIAVLLPARPTAASEPVANWQQTDVKSFYGLDGTTKSQGMASDGRRMFFSWNFGLHSTLLDMTTQLSANLTTGIPADMMAEGSNHIGDIDYYRGRIYAPIEGGPAYLKSYILPFDPDTLQPTGERYLLDHDLLSKGVPWVAIDAPRKVAYTGEWNNQGLLNVHRLSDFKIISTVALSGPIPRIQGAKVYKGILYAARDNGPEKSIDAIDPVTGQITHLFDRNLGDDDEAEGIAFVRNAGGTTMRTADIVETDPRHIDVHSYRINGDVTPPSATVIQKFNPRHLPGQSLRLELKVSEPVRMKAEWLRCEARLPRPCRRTRSYGRAPVVDLEAGRQSVDVPLRRQGAGAGRQLRPGLYRLRMVPIDVADAHGEAAWARALIKTPRR